MTVNDSASLPFDADSSAPIVFSKNKDDNIPSRCGSAPPYLGESFSTTRNPTVKNFYRGMLGLTDDEKLLTDPACIAYYNAHVNLNPRLLPSSTISKERANLVYGRRSNSSESVDNQELSIKLSSLSTHQEEDDALEDPSQSKDEIANGDEAGPSKSFAQLIQGLIDHTRVPADEHAGSKHDKMLLYQTHGAPFYHPGSNIQQMQTSHYTPQATKSHNGMPTFSGTIKPVMLNPGLVPPHYIQFGPRPPATNTYTLPPGVYPPYLAGNLAQNMSSLPFDSSYAHLNLLARGSVQAHPPFPGPYFQYSFTPSNGRHAPQCTQYDLLVAQKDPNLAAALMYRGHRNLGPSAGFISVPQFPMNGRNPMVLGDHTSTPQSSVDSYREQRGQRGPYNVEDPKRRTYLEDLKYGGGVKLELFDIAGKIAEFSTDQHGSRFIQTKLENSTVQEKEQAFTELLPHASKLMIDVFGNYVIQKMFEFGSSEHRKQLAGQFVGQMLTLSLQMYGCRVIQKALEVIEVAQKAALAKELDGHVIQCIHDQNGNHVIQKCIEHIPVEEIGYIISAFHGQVATLSVHPYGCRVIQRALEHCSDTSSTHFIIEEILDSASMLAHDQYGNYVIQHILELGKPHQRSQVIAKMSGKFVEMSQHKYASNVIEKCLIYGDPPQQQSLIKEIVGRQEEVANLLAMVKDQYANYVIQRILEICNDEEKSILMNCIRENLESLKKYTYGKHLVARYEHLLSGGNQEHKAAK